MNAQALGLDRYLLPINACDGSVEDLAQLAPNVLLTL